MRSVLALISLIVIVLAIVTLIVLCILLSYYYNKINNLRENSATQSQKHKKKIYMEYKDKKSKIEMMLYLDVLLMVICFIVFIFS